MRLGIIGFQLDGPPVVRRRFLRTRLILQLDRQIVVGLGQVRIQLEGPPAAGRRFRGLLQRAVRQPKVAMVDRHTRFRLDRPGDVLDGGLVVAGLVREHSQQVQGVGMGRLDRKNPAIDRLGGLQSAGLVVLDRRGQCFGKGCHTGHYGSSRLTCKGPEY